MNSADIITTITEVAVTLVGFSAIVVILNPKPISDWSSIDRMNLRILIQVGAFTAAFSILPFLTHIYFESADAWKYALLAYGFYHLADVGSFIFRLPKNTTLTNRISLTTGVLISILQITAGFVASETIVELVYVGTLAWHLGIAFMGFVLLIYQGKDQGDV